MTCNECLTRAENYSFLFEILYCDNTYLGNWSTSSSGSSSNGSNPLLTLTIQSVLQEVDFS